MRPVLRAAFTSDSPMRVGVPAPLRRDPLRNHERHIQHDRKRHAGDRRRLLREDVDERDAEQHQRDEAEADGNLHPGDLRIHRHAPLARNIGFLEPQHEHRQRLAVVFLRKIPRPSGKCVEFVHVSSAADSLAARRLTTSSITVVKSLPLSAASRSTSPSPPTSRATRSTAPFTSPLMHRSWAKPAVAHHSIYRRAGTTSRSG